MRQGGLEQMMSEAWDRFYGWMAWLHAFLARYLGGVIAWLWRMQGRIPVQAKLSGSFVALGLLAAWCAWFIPNNYITWAMWGPDLERLLERIGQLDAGLRVRSWARIAVVGCIAAAALSWVRRGWALWCLKAAWALWFWMWFNALSWGFTAPSSLTTADFRMLGTDGRNALWAAALGHGSIFLLLGCLVLLWLVLAETRRWYEGKPEIEPLAGDRVVESLRTGGADPRYRTSQYWAMGMFLMVLVGPFLIHGCGMEDPYGLVKGEGSAVANVEVTAVKRIQKKPEKVKKLVVNAWSPYIFDRMKIDDTNVMKDLLDETLDTYVAQTEGATAEGGMGGGKGGKGGWPKGMEGARIRFIRLKYGGGDWDQDMGKGADYNMLIRFNLATGFPIARDTEAIEISRLRRFPKDQAPPFVFLTGRGNINVSNAEIETLRWYLEKEGGMLFIDNGGGHFDRSVVSLLTRIFPRNPLIDIANDDPIFRVPYLFPNGAPPLWHHAGTRARGVKVDGRWVVFYHPGDVNDAWKDGHSGASPAVAGQAYKLGINVMYYSFNNYYNKHFPEK